MSDPDATTTIALATAPATSSLPHGWRWVRLGDVCEVISGSTPRSEVEEYWGGDIDWLTPTDLGANNAVYIDHAMRRITPAGLASANLTIAPVGSVVMSSRAPIGHLAIAGVPVCTNQGCKTFIPDKGVNSDFLYFALKQAMPDIQSMGSGAIFLEVSKSKIEAFSIPLPPPAEQRRIAAILAERMAAVERARAAAEAQFAAAKALPAAELRAVFESEQAQAWPRVRLGDVLQLRKDIVHPYDHPSGPATFVGLEHIAPGTGLRTGAYELEMSELTGRKPRFFAGDIVYGYLRPYLNKVWIANFDGLCSVDQYVYSVDAELADSGYVAWFMRSPVYLERAPIDASPGQLPRIRTEEVAATEISLPQPYVQRQIAGTIDARMADIAQLRATLEAQLDAINALPAALLRQAFNGET